MFDELAERSLMSPLAGMKHTYGYCLTKHLQNMVKVWCKQSVSVTEINDKIGNRSFALRNEEK